VFLINLPENKTATVYVDQNRKLRSMRSGLETFKRYVELQNQTFEFIRCRWILCAREYTAIGNLLRKCLWARIAIE
jgi:hypothetical protein